MEINRDWKKNNKNINEVKTTFLFKDSKIAGAYQVDCLTLSAYTIQAVLDVSQQHGMANCDFGEFS